MRSMIFTVAALLVVGGSVSAAEPIIFPKDGQTKEQVAEDKAFCKQWAEEETEIDPEVIAMKVEEVEEEMTEQKQTKMGGLLGGLFKGAATGAVTGAIGANVNNAVGSDALKGAVLGGVFTHEGQKNDEEDIEYRKENLKRDELKEQYDQYLKALTVCLEAKGYAVK